MKGKIKNKNRAFLWLIPVFITIVMDLLILAAVFKAEFNSISPGEAGHPTGLMTIFVAFILFILTIIISILFIIITIKRYKKLSIHYMDDQKGGSGE